MGDVMNYLYGPLGKEYCMWFYILSVIGFVSLVLFIIPAIYLGIVKHKGFEYYIGILMASVVYGIVYFQNRLLYSMCVGKK